MKEVYLSLFIILQLFLLFQRQKLEQCVEFETRKLQELQSTFESDWIEFRNTQKTRKLVRKFSFLDLYFSRVIFIINNKFNIKRLYMLIILLKHNNFLSSRLISIR